ncbi:putative WD40/YVTN repeat-like-containing domain-containing protein [Rosa chinensis]|uniref:Putative WD40/YVTN repeat-like-containing domain-containing protein n=1 Tax=Rosa chinensis TaxID=74649 RepID=A0A2P6QTD2_ROSCH|nr:putative WD40/YVTN repeat-like-containing domain-containing protein [Rosa chinensis]
MILVLHFRRVFRASSLESKWKIISNFITSRTGEQTCVKFSPDARYIVVGSTNGKENLCNYCKHIIVEEYDYDRPTPADCADVMEMLDCSYAEVMKTIDCYNIH